MPFDLNRRSVNRAGDRALHRQLADALREQIQHGPARPGEALPSEGEISDLVDVSRTTVREALEVLAIEGLIVKRPGTPSRVAMPPPVRHMATSRYADELARLRALDGGDHPLTSAFTEDHGVGWDAYQVEATYVEDAATAADAGRLDIAEDTPVLRRQLVKLVGGAPVQLQESVIPLDLVEGTPVTDPKRQPWPGGTIAELHSVGLIVTRVVEEARARTPTTAEHLLLEMSAPGPVWEVTRIFFVERDGTDMPAEASTVVAPATRMLLRFETDLRTRAG